MNLTGRSYFLITGIILLGIIFEWGPEAYIGIWRMPAAAIIMALLLEGRLAGRRAIHMMRQLQPTAHLGREIKYSLILSNQDPFVLRLESLDNHPTQILDTSQEFHWHVDPNSQSTTSFRVTPIALGLLQWDTVHTRLLGRLGLAWWSRRLSVSGQTNVLPDRLHRSEQRRVSLRHQGEIERTKQGSGIELLTLRDYQSGDPLHYIDWKATARSQHTTVRIYSDEQHLELILIIDAGRSSAIQAGKLSRLGHYTNIAARLAEKSLNNGDQLGVIVFADKVLTSLKGVKGNNGLRRVRALLEELNTIPKESNPLAPIMHVRSLVQHRSLIVMLTDVDDGDAATQLVKAMGIMRPKHLPLLAGIMDSEVLRLQKRPDRNWLAPYHALAAGEMIRSWQRTRLRLERMGVPVALATADQLDHKVLNSYDTLRSTLRVG